MNIKKTLFALTLLVLVLPVLTIPVFAETSYTFSGSSTFLSLDSTVPEGPYQISAALNGESFQSDTPVTITYGKVSFGGESFDTAWYRDVLFTVGGTTMNVPILIVVYDGTTFVHCPNNGSEYSLTLTSTEKDNILPSVVTSDAMSFALNECLSLLPILLIALCGFIAVRKGIAFFQDIVHKA